MKLFKQDYISFDGSGSFVTVSDDARESVVDDACLRVLRCKDTYGLLNHVDS